MNISSISFGESLDENEQMKLRLFSVGIDQQCIEYDVYNSTDQGLLVAGRSKQIEYESTPTACVWYPRTETKEDLLLVANSDYKMKIWNISQ